MIKDDISVFVLHCNTRGVIAGDSRYKISWLTCTPTHFVTSSLGMERPRSSGIPMEIFRLVQIESYETLETNK